MATTATLAPSRAADDDEVRIISLSELRGDLELAVDDEIEVTDFYTDRLWFGRIIELDRQAQLVVASEIYSFAF